MTVVTPGPGGHAFGRGDYGAEYAFEIIEIIERLNCVKGCLRAGDASDIANIGPSGVCEIALRVLEEKPVPEIDHLPSGPVCNARQPILEPDPYEGMEPLLPEASS